MKKSSILLLLVLTMTGPAFAQRYWGVATANGSNTAGIYLNPASIADAPYRFTADVVSLNFGLESNAGELSSGNGIRKFIKGDSVGFGDIFSFSSDRNLDIVAPYAEMRGPGFMWRINRRNSLAFSTRVRGFNQTKDFDQRLYRTIVDEDFRQQNGSYSVRAGRFSWNLHAWSETALTYATVLYDKGPHVLKGGITLRYLGGIGYVSVESKNLDASYNSANDTLYVSNTDVSFSSNISNSGDEFSHGISGSDVIGYFFGNKAGGGIGSDIGLIYEYQPVPEARDYLFRVSAAVSDIGSIRYRKHNRTAYLRGDGQVKAEDLADKLGNFTEFRNYLQAQGISVDTNSNSSRLQLPTSLILHADYHVRKNVFVNLAYTARLSASFAAGNSYFNQLMLTPRYETRLWSAAMPLSYSTLSRQLKAGLGFRVSGFYIGSDDLLALVGVRGQNGLNLYAGGSVPFGRNRD